MRETFKIVRIINDRNIVINAGSEQGISQDDVFEVFLVGDEIKDPETEKALGTLDIIKARLEIKSLYENMCLCHNADTMLKDMFVTASSFTQEKRLPLKVDMTQAQALTIKSDKIIRLGDLVRKSL